MNDELSSRQIAIRLRLAGERGAHVCQTGNPSKAWFPQWWPRYLTMGPDGVDDLTRANHQVARRIPSHLESAILSVRRRLEARTTPQTRSGQLGAVAIRAELGSLGRPPLPRMRPMARLLNRVRLRSP